MFGYDGWSNVKKALVNPRSANSLAFIHRSKKNLTLTHAREQKQPSL